MTGIRDTSFPTGSRDRIPPTLVNAAGATFTRAKSVRVGDAEREEVVSQLTHHFSAGRLTEAELDERVEAAVSAQTRHDLDTLTADLPPVPRGTSLYQSTPPRQNYPHGFATTGLSTATVQPPYLISVQPRIVRQQFPRPLRLVLEAFLAGLMGLAVLCFMALGSEVGFEYLFLGALAGTTVSLGSTYFCRKYLNPDHVCPTCDVAQSPSTPDQVLPPVA